MWQAGITVAFPLGKSSEYIVGYENLRKSGINILILGCVELGLPTVLSPRQTFPGCWPEDLWESVLGYKMGIFVSLKTCLSPTHYPFPFSHGPHAFMLVIFNVEILWPPYSISCLCSVQ